MSELPAGRELDALIAEKVMGLAVVGRATAVYVEGEWSIHPDTEPDGWSCYAAKEPLMVHEGCRCGRGPLRVEAREGIWTEAQAAAENERWRAKYEEEMARFGHEVACLRVVPEYSTSIADAWEVVEKMHERRLFLNLDFDCLSFDGSDWRAFFGWTHENPHPAYIGEAKAAPHAICLAALKAVGI